MIIVEGPLPDFSEIKVAQDAQDHEGCHPLGIRWKSISRVSPVSGPNRLHPIRSVTVKVAFRQHSAMLIEIPDDPPSDIPLIKKATSPVGNGLQRAGEIRLLHDFAGVIRLTIRIQKGSTESFPPLQPPEQVGFILDVPSGPHRLTRGDRISFFSILNGLLEKGGPQKLCPHAPTSVLMRRRPPVHRSRHRIGRQESTARNGIEIARAVVLIDTAPLSRSPRPVEGSNGSGLGIVNQPEVIPADTAHVGINHGADGRSSDGGVDGVTTRLEDSEPCGRGEVMGGRDHPPGGEDGRPMCGGCHYSYHPISRGSQRAISGNMRRSTNPTIWRATKGTMPR